ncbi:hypothetical protein G7Y89_g11821 [Cudoniella acicularis]|uniref:Major facilitator superfamily (MFS) profile domain-containing protein n=1 Tax=Cudoniella acicularis TaxID=354080 RepID=A0A8H4W0A1_9HELO|nr:hypothetical protein G7Y89_g11821 [Cudoniella acicularis]
MRVVRTKQQIRHLSCTVRTEARGRSVTNLDMNPTGIVWACTPDFSELPRFPIYSTTKAINMIGNLSLQWGILRKAMRGRCDRLDVHPAPGYAEIETLGIGQIARMEVFKAIKQLCLEISLVHYLFTDNNVPGNLSSTCWLSTMAESRKSTATSLMSEDGPELIVTRVSEAEWISGIPSRVPSTIPASTPGIPPSGGAKYSWHQLKVPRQVSGVPNGNGKSRLGSWVSRRLSQDSFNSATGRGSTESIKVFTQMKDVSRFSESEVSEGGLSDGYEPKTPREDIAIPVPAIPAWSLRQNNKVGLQKLPTELDSEVEAQTSNETGVRVISYQDSVESSRKTQDLYDSFPTPPSTGVNNSPNNAAMEQTPKWDPISPSPSFESGLRRMGSSEKVLPEPPYHIFSIAKKRHIVYLLSFTGTLLILSITMYFPVINAVATSFHVNTAVALATISTFMIFRAITPFLWLPICQSVGRRSLFIVLPLTSFFFYIGLALTNNLAGFFILRILQAASIAAFLPLCKSSHLTLPRSPSKSQIAIAIINDISIGEERSALVGSFNKILLISHFLGPVLGGAFSQRFGFHSIFVFLCILTGIASFILITFLPETHRKIAGNGTTPLPWWQNPLINRFNNPSQPPITNEKTATTFTKPPLQDFASPFQNLRQLDLTLSIFFGSLVFALFISVLVTTAPYSNHASTSRPPPQALFSSPPPTVPSFAYPLTNLLLSRDYRIISKIYKTEHHIPDEKPINPRYLPDFPIEKARLRNMRPFILAFIGVTGGYGFSVHGKHLVVPLVLQFFIAGSGTVVLMMNSILISDLYPSDSDSSASIELIVNLCRLLLGALLVGIIQPLINGLDVKFTFLMLSMILLFFTPILLFQWFYGVKWRMQRESQLRENSQDGSFMELGVSRGEELMWKFSNEARSLWEKIVQETSYSVGKVRDWARKGEVKT